MNPIKVILGLVPFALFSILTNWLPVGWAGLIGAAMAFVLICADIRGGIKSVPVAGVIILGGFAAIGFLADAQAQIMLATYGRGLATLLLAIFILSTATFAPFTSGYAKEAVDQQHWNSPAFRSTNRRISLTWGGAVLVMAAGHLLAEAISAAGVSIPALEATLNWVLPILLIVRTVKYTKQFVDDAQNASA